MLEQEGLVYSKVGSGTFVRGNKISKQETHTKIEYKKMKIQR
ncbi:hypothetical protein PL321_13720 [Caloramator sp. mosi_1]|nr:hypothetical protein [Caloramator sp. mosi_1]WDC83652.1 hypothetical protein PL321_13720 [Caloramator sp. mosi_1]